MKRREEKKVFSLQFVHASFIFVSKFKWIWKRRRKKDPEGSGEKILKEKERRKKIFQEKK